MATIVNAQPAETSSGAGWALGIALLVLFLLLIVWMVPQVFQWRSIPVIQSPTVNVPDQIDVNVNPQGDGGQNP